MKITLFASLLATASLALAASGPAARNRGQAAVAPQQSCSGECPALAASTAPVSLNDTARTALLFQIEEERMARELYTAFGAKWDLPPFTHIPQAESRHESALRALAQQAGVAVPAATAGQFVSAEVQKRYDALLALGRQSAESALQAGAFVEEQDIADLRTLAATTDSAELGRIAAALERASGHHLSAFVRSLAASGVDYKPQVLSADDFAALANSAGGPGQGRGRGGQGFGQGQGQGRNRAQGDCPNGGICPRA